MEQLRKNEVIKAKNEAFEKKADEDLLAKFAQISGAADLKPAGVKFELNEKQKKELRELANEDFGQTDGRVNFKLFKATYNAFGWHDIRDEELKLMLQRSGSHLNGEISIDSFFDLIAKQLEITKSSRPNDPKGEAAVTAAWAKFL